VAEFSTNTVRAILFAFSPAQKLVRASGPGK
jgi:hypothetical protein